MVKEYKDSLMEAQNTAVHLLEMLDSVPKLKSDPVVQALIHKLCGMVVKDFGSDQSFKTVGVAMNALRSAGVFEPTTHKTANEENPGKSRPEPKSKAKSTLAVTPQKATEKGQKMRGLDRGIDMLLEFGYLTQDDIKMFRNLRSDPMLLIKFTKGGEELQRRVKDTGDWDLLYSMDKTMYAKWDSMATQMRNEFNTAQGAFEPESFLTVMESALDKSPNGEWSNADYAGLRSVLKGPPLDVGTKILKKKPDDFSSKEFLTTIHDLVLQQQWYKFGKSPTLDTVSEGAGSA
jgi:hypothetical protein